MAGWDCTGTRQALGVYVLGAIDPAERSLVDQHTTRCGECREELAGLAGLPALLSRVSADEVARIADGGTAGSPGDLTTLSLGTARRRRSRRWRVMAGAAAVIAAAAGTVTGFGLASGPGPAARSAAPPASWQAARTVSALHGVTATLRYGAQPWGTAADVHITGVPVGAKCTLWVTGPDGAHLAAGSWAVAPDAATAWYPGSSWVPAARVQGFSVTTGNRQVAVFVPR